MNNYNCCSSYVCAGSGCKQAWKRHDIHKEVGHIGILFIGKYYQLDGLPSSVISLSYWENSETARNPRFLGKIRDFLLKIRSFYKIRDFLLKIRDF